MPTPADDFNALIESDAFSYAAAAIAVALCAYAVYIRVATTATTSARAFDAFVRPSDAAVWRLLKKVGMQSLEEAVHATRLQWYNKNLDDDDAKVVAHVVAVSRSLTSLVLYTNTIGDEGVKALAAGLAANTSLKELWLGENQIGDEGAKALAAGVAANSSLTELYLDHQRYRNKKLSDAAKESLRDAVRERQGFDFLKHRIRAPHGCGADRLKM